MNTQDCIATKLDIREFSKENVSSNIISAILDSARYSGSGLNTQHWRFIVIKEHDNLKKLSEEYGMTILVVTHDEEMADRYAKYHIYIRDGKIVNNQR